ncbi:MAG: NACHT domain-containing protein [Bacteroidales bacterium]|nr:NACHT domain-containing protein [Bacteroidales bacterium]
METKKGLPILIGKEIEKEIDSTYWKDITIDLSELGSLFITGWTGSGKTTFLHRIITSLLQLKQSSKNDIKLVLAEDFLVEFSLYEKLDCVQQTIINNQGFLIQDLQDAVAELNKRLQHPNQTYSDYILIVDKFDDFFAQVNHSYSKSQKIIEPIYQLVEKGSPVNMYVILSSQRADSNFFRDQLKSVMKNRIVFLSEFDNEKVIKETFGVNVDTSYTLPHDMLTYLSSFERIMPIRPLPEQSYAEIGKMVEQFNAQ